MGRVRFFLTVKGRPAHARPSLVRGVVPQSDTILFGPLPVPAGLDLRQFSARASQNVVPPGASGPGGRLRHNIQRAYESLSLRDYASP